MPLPLKNVDYSNDFNQTIGANLRHLRISKGFTQKQVATALDVSFQQIQKYETGQNRLPIEKLLLLRELFAIPLENFFVDSYTSPVEPYDSVYHEGIRQRFESLKSRKDKEKIYRIIDILISA